VIPPKTNFPIFQLTGQISFGNHVWRQLKFRSRMTPTVLGPGAVDLSPGKDRNFYLTVLMDASKVPIVCPLPLRPRHVRALVTSSARPEPGTLFMDPLGELPPPVTTRVGPKRVILSVIFPPFPLLESWRSGFLLRFYKADSFLPPTSALREPAG